MEDALKVIVLVVVVLSFALVGSKVDAFVATAVVNDWMASAMGCYSGVDTFVVIIVIIAGWLLLRVIVQR